MPDESIIVVKIGGSTLGAEDTSFADVAALQRRGLRPIVVHGGGPAVTSWMAKLGIEARFVGGLRVTDAPSLEVVTAVLAGMTNKQLVARLAVAGARAVGLSGVDGTTMRGVVTEAALGFVGGTVEVDPALLLHLANHGYVPVVAPIAVDKSNSEQLLNVNADTAAGAIAVALGAARLVFLTDVDGILDESGTLLRQINSGEGDPLMRSGVVKGGMIPKLEACLTASAAGAVAHIVNGTRPSALLGCIDGTLLGTTVS